MGDLCRNRTYAAVLVLLAIGSMIGCTEVNTNAPGVNAVHVPNWTNPNLTEAELFHGTAAKTEGAQTCTKCHDLNDQGQNPIPGCFVCHFGPDGSRIPVGSNWLHGRDGHESFEESQVVCNACHEVERCFGLEPRVCHNCHGSGEEHVLGRPWLDRESTQFHGSKSQKDCQGCHNPPTDYCILPNDCYTCHFGPTGRKSPPGSGWPHGAIDNHDDQESYAGVCNRCHYLTQSYRNEPDSSCHDCHDD